ncbi:D-Ala-D-Ala carboxypeptidase family metallohydrolase [Halomonas sp. AOP43-D1-4]|uniref:D-Ala-D-Ala carboxypeptidase family metallohydrolase n=1 Tax=Halomonas sp. AOP43-D1-4 TaxID=3457658 RepID=UPI00403476EC
MPQVSQHFQRREFACRCGCGFDTVDSQTLAALEAIRTHFGQPVTVTSGCRCAAHNARVGGARNSQHTLGRAADIKVSNVAPAQVAAWAEVNLPHASVGRYSTFTHIDTRSTGPARWRG